MRAAEEFLREAENNCQEILMLLKDAMNLVAYYRRLLEHLEVDTLTGLPGDNKFRELMAEIGTKTAGIGIIFFDVNDLKFYNDTQGHKAGDLLLQKASESIFHITGKNARAFRVGGDEFVVVVTDCDGLDELNSMISKWREKLAEINSSSDRIHCSVAVGAAVGFDGEAISNVLEKADKLMYADKKRIKQGCVN